jgi:sigma-B regulation protein RsbQ
MDVLRRNNVKILGTGGPVLMFGHGYGCDQTMWDAVIPSFLDGHTVILFDYVGAGDSVASQYDPERYSSLRGYAQDVLDICHTLQLWPMTFVGHSVSAMIGALAAIMEPERFANLVMIGGSPCYLNEADYKGGFEQEDLDMLLNALENNYEGWSTKMAPVIAGNPDKPEVAKKFAATLGLANRSIAKSFARVTFLTDNRGILPRLTTRTLILMSEEDIIIGPDVGWYLTRNVQDSRFQMLNATGHLPHVSAPGVVVKALKDFLAD